MVDRVYMRGSPPRLITSKPGYDASPTLGDVYKTFDSDWFYGAGIRWMFRIDIPAGNPASKTVIFPYALDHIPRYSFFSGGYTASGAAYPPNQGVEWPFDLNPGPYFSTAWQAAPATGNPDWGGTYARCYSDRFVINNVFGLAGGQFRTLIVYQS